MYQPLAATRSTSAATAASGAGEPTWLGRHLLRPIGWQPSLRRRADFQRVGAHGLGDVLQRHRTEIAHLDIEPSLDLPVGLFREADCAGLGHAFETRRDIHPVAHEVAVALLDNVSEMDADSKLDALVGPDLGVALDHRPLDFNGAVHCVDDAAEFNDASVARALDDAAVMHRDGRVNQVAAKSPKASEDSILIRTRKPRVADHVGHQNRRELSGLAHGASAEARSPVAGGLGMAAFPCCTDETRRPGMQARRSVASLAALARCVRRSNAKHNARAQLVGGQPLAR